MTPRARISVIICTHNRMAYLALALEGLARQTLDRGAFEVIVVDNCSTDGTRDTVARAAGSGLPVVYVHDPVLGASHARNTGWRSASSPLAAFLDDDAIPEPGWLEAIERSFAVDGAGIGIVAGRIKPLWLGEPPRWAHPTDELLLSYIDYSPERMDIEPPRTAVGANMIIPVAVLKSIDGFRDELGRKGGSLLGCEDVYLERQVRAAGLRVVYDPEIAVGHHIHANRLTPFWRYRHAYWQGASFALCDRLHNVPATGQRIAQGLRRGLTLLIPPVRTILLAPFGRRSLSNWFFSFCMRSGYAAGLLGIHNLQIQNRKSGRE